MGNLKGVWNTKTQDRDLDEGPSVDLGAQLSSAMGEEEVDRKLPAAAAGGLGPNTARAWRPAGACWKCTHV